MDISAAALPPIQPTASAADRQHPRFGEYQAYAGGCSCQLITAMSFPLWLRETERTEWEAVNWEEHVFQVKIDPARRLEIEQFETPLANGWYKHIFAPGHRLSERRGPFPDRDQALAA